MPKQQARATTNSSRRSQRSLAKSAKTRRRVLDATARVLIEKGYVGTRLSDIAEQADLQAGSLYYYFASREQLVEEVLRYSVQFCHAHVRAAVEQLPDDATPGDRLRVAVGAYLEAMLDIGELASAHVHCFNQVPADMQERLRPVRRGFGKFWEDCVSSAIASGEVRDDVDPYVLRLFITNILERAVEWPPRTRRSAGDLEQTLHTLIFHGVEPGDGGR